MIYDYKCVTCGVIREERHGINETPDIRCQGDTNCKCGSDCNCKMEKVYLAAPMLAIAKKHQAAYAGKQFFPKKKR